MIGKLIGTRKCLIKILSTLCLAESNYEMNAIEVISNVFEFPFYITNILPN